MSDLHQPKILKLEDGTVLIERFKPIRRVEHLFGILCFVLLVLTGFPQKFYEANWATSILQWFGGLDQARKVHHIVGIIFFIHTMIHLGAIVVGILMKKMRLTLFPTPQDFRDVIDTLRYYFGYSKEHPKYPLFDYRQKFEYIGLLLGGAVVIFSGFILLYPGLISNFLPGEIIPAAREAHSNEAMLALLVLVVWHVYGAHLSPDVFPGDKSIFTGYMTKEELKAHHALEYERIFGPIEPEDPISQENRKEVH